MKTATHSGTCQVCGRCQKLPGGVLSKHGYTVAGFGYFNGVCRGADHPSFELSKDLIEKMIEEVSAHRATLLTAAAVWREPVVDRRAWVREYVGGRFGGGRYVWRHVEIVGTAEHRSYGLYCGNLGWVNEAGKVDNLHSRGQLSYESFDRIEDVLRAMNERYAKKLDGEAEAALQYVRWQQGRIDGWKPRPDLLVPVEKEAAR